MYVRVSREDMHPENQRLELERYAKEKGWDYEVFEERESTRKTRPVKDALYRRLLRREFDGILIWKLDRWARSSRELLDDIDMLVSRGLHLIVMTQPIDTTSAVGRLQLQILAAFAEFERSLISERTRAGLARARARGKKLGRPRKHPPISPPGAV
ncbi:MAG: recombinase family protein [Dehalococcoidia bacterium]